MEYKGGKGLGIVGVLILLVAGLLYGFGGNGTAPLVASSQAAFSESKTFTTNSTKQAEGYIGAQGFLEKIYIYQDAYLENETNVTIIESTTEEDIVSVYNINQSLVFYPRAHTIYGNMTYTSYDVAKMMMGGAVKVTISGASTTRSVNVEVFSRR